MEAPSLSELFLDAAGADATVLGGAGLSEAEVQDVIAAPGPRLQEVQQETSSRRAASFVLSLRRLKLREVLT